MLKSGARGAKTRCVEAVEDGWLDRRVCAHNVDGGNTKIMTQKRKKNEDPVRRARRITAWLSVLPLDAHRLCRLAQRILEARQAKEAGLFLRLGLEPGAQRPKLVAHCHQIIVH